MDLISVKKSGRDMGISVKGAGRHRFPATVGADAVGTLANHHTDHAVGIAEGGLMLVPGMGAPLTHASFPLIMCCKVINTRRVQTETVGAGYNACAIPTVRHLVLWPTPLSQKNHLS